MQRLGLVVLGIWLACFSGYGQNAVVAPEPIAAEVGIRVLEKGRNAMDGAAAIAFALAVTYPQAGNIGVGGFAMVYRAGNEPVALDFREKAPAAAGRDMCLDRKRQVIRKRSGKLLKDPEARLLFLMITALYTGSKPMSQSRPDEQRNVQ